MHKTLVFTAFSLLCTTHCARMWNRTRCHKRPCQLRRCTKHWYLPRFRFFVQHTVQGCGTGHVVTSVHANCDDAQNTGSCRVFASLYNTLCKDVEQDTLSQASMPIATMPKTLVFTAFSPRCTTYCTRMCNKKSCHKRPCLWLKHDLIQHQSPQFSINRSSFFPAFLTSCFRNPPKTQVKRTFSYTQTPRRSMARIPGSYMVP